MKNYLNLSQSFGDFQLMNSAQCKVIGGQNITWTYVEAKYDRKNNCMIYHHYTVTLNTRTNKREVCVQISDGATF